jgi:acetyl esterase
VLVKEGGAVAKERRAYSRFVLFCAVAVAGWVPIRDCAAQTDVPPVAPDRAVSAFLAGMARGSGSQLPNFSAGQVRDAFSALQRGFTPDVSGVDISTRRVEQDGTSVPITVVRPHGAVGMKPAFIFLHGGGWVSGDFKSHERLVLDLVVQTGAVAVFVDYSRAPEAPYPRAVSDAYAATAWVASHGSEVGIDGTRLAVVGNSAGGNLAAAVCLMAKDRHGPSLRFEGLMWPITDSDVHDGSYERYSHGYSPGPALMAWFWREYVPDEKRREEIYAAPLRASVDQLRGLPPTLIQLAQFDVLHDEGAAYGRKLDAAGVAVTTASYAGTIHNFALLNALADDAPSQSAIRQLATELKFYLK